MLTRQTYQDHLYYITVQDNYAYLAESKRVEGKPRQRIITYLASIPVWATQDHYSSEYKAFWYKAHCSLLLAQVSRGAYENTLDELGKRVLRPDINSFITILRERHELHPRWKKEHEAISKIWEKGTNYYLECLVEY